MKYLITGITGFVGPHLAKILLDEGHEVHGLVRATSGRETDILDVLSPEYFSRIVFHKVDLLHYGKLMEVIEQEFDGVFHLAAQSHPAISFSDPVMTFENNVMGSVNLITLIEKYSPDTKLHLCSTSEVYGDQCKETGILYETDPIKPVNPYGVSKASVDIYMQERIKNNKIKGFITRAFSHTGPRRFRNFSISSDAYQLAVMKKNNEKTTLWVGNLQTQRVVIDVRDVARAYYLLMEKCTDSIIGTSMGGVYNICGDHIHKMIYFTNKLIEISQLGVVSTKIHQNLYRPVDIEVQIGDSNKLRDLTGWAPKIDIEQTLTDLFNYWMKKI